CSRVRLMSTEHAHFAHRVSATPAYIGIYAGPHWIGPPQCSFARTTVSPHVRGPACPHPLWASATQATCTRAGPHPVPLASKFKGLGAPQSGRASDALLGRQLSLKVERQKCVCLARSASGAGDGLAVGSAGNRLVSQSVPPPGRWQNE